MRCDLDGWSQNWIPGLARVVLYLVNLSRQHGITEHEQRRIPFGGVLEHRLGAERSVRLNVCGYAGNILILWGSPDEEREDALGSITSGPATAAGGGGISGGGISTGRADSRKYPIVG